MPVKRYQKHHIYMCGSVERALGVGLPGHECPHSLRCPGLKTETRKWAHVTKTVEGWERFYATVNITSHDAGAQFASWHDGPKCMYLLALSLVPSTCSWVWGT